MSTKTLKGISPLVAVIMLIAFTMVVAGILASWASTFATQSREQLQFCSKAQMIISKGVYQNATNTLDLYIYNMGKVPLEGFKITLSYINGSLSSYDRTLNLTAGDIQKVTVDIRGSLDQANVQSKRCPGAQDIMTRYDVKGIGY